MQKLTTIGSTTESDETQHLGYVKLPKSPHCQAVHSSLYGRQHNGDHKAKEGAGSSSFAPTPFLPSFTSDTVQITLLDIL